MKYLLLTILVFPLISAMAFGESEHQPIKDSKYIASALIELRDSNGNLVSTITSQASKYLPEPIVDEFLDQYDVVKTVNVNGKSYELRQIVLTEKHEKDSYGFQSKLSVLDDNEKVTIFGGSNHAFLVKSGDVSTITWTVLRHTN
jgi:hypothetical protein